MKKFITIIIILCIGIYIGSNLLKSSEEEDIIGADITTTDYTEDQYEEEQEGKEEEEEEYNLENLADPEDIYADFSVEVNSDNSFLVTTNLPGGTELSLTLKGRGYLAQGKAIVSDGCALSPVFTNQGKPLKGDFTLEVMMPIPNVQNDYVKHFIGERGEYLKGDYIEPAMGTVVVRKEFDVTLPGTNNY